MKKRSEREGEREEGERGGGKEREGEEGRKKRKGKSKLSYVLMVEEVQN